MKYSKYIELSAGWESVVDLELEDRNPNLWRDYIVHDDMKNAIEAICQTLSLEDKDKRRSFWIHGAYGTGKSYAAIVLKHLFEDKVQNIESFMSNPLLLEYKKQFIKEREKGNFLVVWNYGTVGIKSGTHLLMEMEYKIKEKLREKFGDKAYTGHNSIITAAKDVIQDKSINWDHLFTDIRYGLSDDNKNFKVFQQKVLDGDYDAISLVKRICDENKFAMFAGIVERFEEWIKDIIEGNGLQNTGIVFIWDEFTGFLRDCGDDNVLQRLSEFCKQPKAPFFMCLIVHRDPTWVKDIGDETYERILHRYHALKFHITESAAYDLIGGSIIARSGMDSQWKEVKKGLVKSIEKYITEFANLRQSGNIYNHFEKLCPIHPMTIEMLAIVAENFSASQRTLFRFMKDSAKTSKGIGFIHYIDNNEPDKWQWLTIDYLWDYFFSIDIDDKDSDFNSFTPEALKTMQHFQNNAEHISDEYMMHVFKAIMLLCAVMSGSSVSNLYSKQRQTSGKISATRNTLYKCFRGQLEQDTIDKYLTTFLEIGLISIAEQHNGDARIELPYIGSTDTFNARLEATQKKYTRYELFKNNGYFSKALENVMWDSTRATFKRIYIATCSSETNSIKARVGEVEEQIQKYPYKIGIIIVIVTEASEYASFQTKIRQLATDNESKRLVVAMLREACTPHIIYNWCVAFTRKELCAEEGITGSANRYEEEAQNCINKWVNTAINSQIYACYGDIPFTSVYGKSDLMKCVEKDILYSVFPLAPERLVTSNTAFKTCTDNVIVSGLSKQVKNTQINNIVEALRKIDAWEIDQLEGLCSLSGENASIISELASCFQQEFQQGAKIYLSELWKKLQNPPFGYYNSMTVGCFIGLVLREYIKGPFNWFDGTNTHPPETDNLARMICIMMDGKATGHYMASGTKIWRQFKPYIESIFNLSPTESVNDNEARKYIKVKIIETGVPFWVMKYVPADQFGGNDQSKIAHKIIDLLCSFIDASAENMENVMADVLTQFSGNGNLRKAMATIFADKKIMFSAFKHYLVLNVPEIESISEHLELTDKDIFNTLSRYMQDSIPTWKEEKVLEKLKETVQEMEVLATLKKELGINDKSYISIQNTLKNVFEHMKVPGSVIETLPFSWISALKLLREISKTSWAELKNKESIVKTLTSNAKTAWEFLAHPKLLLEIVLKKHNVNEKELDDIYQHIVPMNYDTTKSSFDQKLNDLLDKVQYNRDVMQVNERWFSISGKKTIKEWCASNNIPVAWLFKSEQDLVAIRTIKSLQDGQAVVRDALSNALIFLNKDLAILKDHAQIKDRFFAYIGENYRPYFEKDEQILFNRLKTDTSISYDVYTWENKIGAIKRNIDTYLQKNIQEEAMNRVKTMPSEDLRNVVLQLLENNPSLCNNFLKK